MSLKRRTCPTLLAALLVVVALLQGCVFVPITTEVYDPGCHIQAKEMSMQPVQVAAFASCRGNECAALLVFVGATAAASAVVSGSIVVVGNVAYWFEKQGRCLRDGSKEK
jgi:hypothetical protein